jgi:PTS system galactitol-specific IIC component
MVPITLLLAIILPGNKVLPFGDLATIPFLVAMMVPIVSGNVVRATITSTVVMIPTIYIMNAISGLHTQVARSSGFAFPEGASAISSICDGGNWVSALLAWISQTSFWVGNIVVVIVLAVVWFLFKKNAAGWHKAAGFKATK